MIQLLKKEYDGESLYDLNRDVSECIMEDFNELVKQIPVDEHGFQKGKFTVTVRWEADDS